MLTTLFVFLLKFVLVFVLFVAGFVVLIEIIDHL